jgi:hypothetical protein
MAIRQADRGQLAFSTPEDWFPVRLPRSRADVDGLVLDVAAAHPELNVRRDAWATMLDGLPEAAAAVNAICAYAVILDVPAVPVPVPATLLVSVLAMGARTAGQVARDLSDGQDTAAPAEIGLFDLPAGPTARIERLVVSPGTAGDRRPASLTVKYVTEIPGRRQAAVLAFATPAAAQAGPLRPLFHQIACTLQVNPAGRARPHPRGHPYPAGCPDPDGAR